MEELTGARILIADDEPSNVKLLERLLEQAGYKNIQATTDSRQIEALYAEFQPDLILLDLIMPHLDGIAVMQQLPIPKDQYVPILVLTADVTAEAKQRALTAGAKDFLTKPFDRSEVLLRIKNLLHTRFLYRELERHNESLEQLVAERTQRLLQSEKVATMGSLLAGVAHELNNPLAVLMAHGQLLKERAGDGGVQKRAGKIVAAAERCARIVKNYLALARQRPPERTEVRINAVVEGALEMLGYELRTDGIEIVLDLAERLPHVWADGHQLHQVLVNVITNAHHAMRKQAGPRRLRITTRLGPGGARVRLTVADSGPGIPAELRDKIFEPFFTTKPAGEGTGLGLSLCRNIIADHDGTITAESQPGQGATFVIELPVTSRTSRAADGDAIESPAPIAPKRMLVVDDEPEVAAALCEILKQAGHDVDTALDGASALDLLARRAYDLVLSDTKMPGMDGVSFFRQLQRRFPTLAGRFIFVTGDLLSRDKIEFLESTGAPFLTKPFDVDEVRCLVHRMLSARPAQPDRLDWVRQRD